MSILSVEYYECDDCGEQEERDSADYSGEWICYCQDGCCHACPGCIDNYHWVECCEQYLYYEDTVYCDLVNSDCLCRDHAVELHMDHFAELEVDEREEFWDEYGCCTDCGVERSGPVPCPIEPTRQGSMIAAMI
jgi:hypothetical protein